ncbi:hypothetical protein, partial [Thiolapillus sp.]|uniref:hypothetical protein n=1 Tax=Thiolapillus sp. TaxID=2017437 RepID=UPI003AF6FF17
MAKRHGRRTAGAIMVVALVSRFWRLGCPKIYHEVATRLVCDREADFFELFDEQRQNPGVDLLIRAQYDRKLDTEPFKL